MQKRYGELAGSLEVISEKIKIFKKIEKEKSSIRIDAEKLQQKTRISLDELSEIKNKAIKLFNENSETLYNSPGILSIEAKKSGYAFSVDIKRQGSQGIEHMKIFCYDLMESSVDD